MPDMEVGIWTTLYLTTIYYQCLWSRPTIHDSTINFNITTFTTSSRKKEVVRIFKRKVIKKEKKKSAQYTL